MYVHIYISIHQSVYKHVYKYTHMVRIVNMHQVEQDACYEMYYSRI